MIVIILLIHKQNKNNILILYYFVKLNMHIIKLWLGIYMLIIIECFKGIYNNIILFQIVCIKVSTTACDYYLIYSELIPIN